MSSSRILESRVISNTSGTRDQTDNLDIPFKINPNRKHWVRLIKVILSKSIPNIYTIGTFNNTKINITKDGGSTWDTIQLVAGKYTVQSLNAAITQSMLQLTYFTNLAEPPITLAYNLSTEFAYVTLDSAGSTFTGTQIGIDFTAGTTSTINTNLGFISSSTFTTDATHQADAYPQMDQQGTTIDVNINIATGLKSINGSNVNTLVTVPLAGGSDNEYIYPSGGIVSPMIPISISSDIMAFKVSYLTSTGATAYWLLGNTITEIEVIES